MRILRLSASSNRSCRLAIPAEFARTQGIEAGDTVYIRATDRALILTKRPEGMPRKVIYYNPARRYLAVSIPRELVASLDWLKPGDKLVPTVLGDELWYVPLDRFAKGEPVKRVEEVPEIL